jgi:hypothetical protein
MLTSNLKTSKQANHLQTQRYHDSGNVASIEPPIGEVGRSFNSYLHLSWNEEEANMTVQGLGAKEEMRRLIAKHPDGLAGFEGCLTPTVAEKVEKHI